MKQQHLQIKTIFTVFAAAFPVRVTGRLCFADFLSFITSVIAILFPVAHFMAGETLVVVVFVAKVSVFKQKDMISFLIGNLSDSTGFTLLYNNFQDEKDPLTSP